MASRSNQILIKKMESMDSNYSFDYDDDYDG